MTLQGALDTFPLPDVLRLLAATGKTGGLHVKGPDASGSLWLVDGKVERTMVGGDSCEPADAVFRLLRNVEGSFLFEPRVPADLPPAAGEGPVDVPELLEEAGRRLQEWDELGAVIPGVDALLTLCAATGDEVRLTAEEWSMVVAVGDGRSLQEVADALGVPQLDALRRARDLVTAGLLVARPAASTPDPALVGDRLEAMALPTPPVVTLRPFAHGWPPTPVNEQPSAVWGPDGLPGPAVPAETAVPEPVRIQPGTLGQEDWAQPAVPSPASVGSTPAPAAAGDPTATPGHEEGVDRSLLLRFLGSVED